MLPVVAIVGKPNVGKSTLFNCLTRSRDALISAYPGMTRDRQYGEVNVQNRRFILIDTGGITEEKDAIGEMITKQALEAIDDADKIIFMIDGKNGLTEEDKAIANLLRQQEKPIALVMNKTEGQEPNLALLDAYELGIDPQPLAISTAHRIGITKLIEKLFPENIEKVIEEEKTTSIKLAIIGRPNVGKSTLTNRMLGEERVIVHDSPGTTRDSIFIPLERFGKHFTIIDTAGVRKRKKIIEEMEKFSVVKTLQAIEDTHVVLFLIDARLGVSEQDLKLLSFVLECGKALVLAINKWDGLTLERRDQTKSSIDRQLDFVSFARIHYISALHGTGVGNLFDSVIEAYESATKPLSSSQLTRLLQRAQLAHSPPLVKGRRIKLRYAHPGGHNPPRIIIHGNQVDELPESYKKFLVRFFQEKLKLIGTPVMIEFKSSENPYDKKKK